MPPPSWALLPLIVLRVRVTVPTSLWMPPPSKPNEVLSLMVLSVTSHGGEDNADAAAVAIGRVAADRAAEQSQRAVITLDAAAAFAADAAGSVVADGAVGERRPRR